MSKQRTKIERLVGILESGEILYIDSFHWNGVCTTRFDYVTQGMIDDRNDVDELKSTYDYLWQEAVADGSTELGLEEYLEELVESETTYGGKYFFGQDDSYLHYITREDHAKLEAYYKSDIETFECVGGGTGRIREEKFQKIFDQELLDAAIDHELTIEAEQARETARKTKLQLV